MTLDKKTLDSIKEKVEELIDMGESTDHAISIVCDTNGYNPQEIKNKLHLKSEEKEHKYHDIKNSEGSYVVLKKDPSKQYEVINIVNKDEIILRCLDDNSEIVVSEKDIVSIVTENKMKKLNEANYTVSIDNLETTDAETLSQMLSLAGQAEQPTSDFVDTSFEELPTMDAPVAPEMDMEEPVIGPEVGMEELPGEESVPATDSEIAAPTEEPSFGPEEFEQYPVTEGVEKIKEDVILPKEEADPTKVAMEKEDKESVPGEEIEKDTIEVSDEDIEEQIRESLRIAGVQLDEVSDKTAEMGIKDKPTPAKGEKANPVKKEQDGFKPGENQRPDWKEDNVTEKVTGAESSEGTHKPYCFCCKETVNRDRIEAICETAARMYAKKDQAEWLALDRRYVEKLILSGVSYSSASKMLLKAKAGK